MKGQHGWKSIVISSAVFLLMAGVLILALVLSGEEGATSTDNGNSKEALSPEQLESIGLEAVHKQLPQAASMENVSTDVMPNTYSLKDGGGNNLGMISVDGATGKIGFFYNTTENGPQASATINLDMDQARGIFKGFLLEEYGIDIDEGQVTITNEELRGKGMVGPPDDPVEIFEYSFEFGETVNGIRVGGGITGAVTMSPEDGGIIGYTINRGYGNSAGKEFREVKLSREEAVAVAIEAAQERLQVTTTPTIPDFETMEYADFGDGHMTPYLSLQLRFDSDTICVVVFIDTGEVIFPEVDQEQ